MKLPCLGCRITAVFRWRRPANILLRPRFQDFRIPRQSSRGEGTLLIVSEHKVAKRTNRNHGLFPVQHEERINAFSICRSGPPGSFFRAVSARADDDARDFESESQKRPGDATVCLLWSSPSFPPARKILLIAFSGRRSAWLRFQDTYDRLGAQINPDYDESRQA